MLSKLRELNFVSSTPEDKKIAKLMIDKMYSNEVENVTISADFILG